MTAPEIQWADFLQWALPRLELRWPGFRKVRRQVIKRIARRIEELQLGDVGGYRRYLEVRADEWSRLDGFCRITISRFYRDRRIFDILACNGLPELIRLCRARGERRLLCWSAGCGAGEEAYTLVLIWALRIAPQVSDISFEPIATDADPDQIARARRGCYPPSSLKELPSLWRGLAFTEEQGRYCIKPEYRRPVNWAVQDLRKTMPDGPFDLILCRNLAFTYFSAALQRETLRRLDARLTPGGLLVIGAHESLPEVPPGWSPWSPGLPIYGKGR
ncbi:CheR family methyltransferase [Methylocaldum sp. MU1018]